MLAAEKIVSDGEADDCVLSSNGTNRKRGTRLGIDANHDRPRIHPKEWDVVRGGISLLF